MADVQTQGKIVQCIGAVVDVEFPRNAMPHIYDALKMDGGELKLIYNRTRQAAITKELSEIVAGAAAV